MANAKKTSSAKKTAKKTAPAEPTSRRHPHVDIDIPHVTSKTKVSSLTVGQLVDILVQVHVQLPVQRGVPSPKVISDAISAIHQIIASPDDAFRKTQEAILKEMPKILRELPYSRKDGGRAPPDLAAKPTTTPKPIR